MGRSGEFMRLKKMALQLMLLMIVFCGRANVHFAPIFNEGAVLQCELPVNVWGTSDPGATVTVLFAGQKKNAVSDECGKWQVILDPMPASAVPCKMVVHSSIGNQLSEINNVVVGEVWLASGQSNIVVPLRNSDGGAARLEKTVPEIRFIKVPQQTGLPPAPLSAAQLSWKTFAPPENQQIAAVAFFFAEYLLTNIAKPVGIIQSSYGGTPCHAWMSLESIEKAPSVRYMAEELRKGLSASRTDSEWKQQITDYSTYWRTFVEWEKNPQGDRPVDPGAVSMDNPFWSQSPSVLYDNMIKPLIPYTARGVIWYQGETGASKPDEYRVLFPALITAWRDAWDRPDWPFLFVQLATYDSKNGDFVGQRAVQALVRDTVPHTGMALAIDCGEKADIHPRAKQPVGERLARLALKQVYGMNMASRGPMYQTLEKDGSSVRVKFKYSEKTLKTSGGNPSVPGFELAGADGVFHPALAEIISENEVRVICNKVKAPLVLRYAWANWLDPPVTLQNSAGLPAEPFFVPLGL
jgi:sialate O-acetylesterase